MITIATFFVILIKLTLLHLEHRFVGRAKQAARVGFSWPEVLKKGIAYTCL